MAKKKPFVIETTTADKTVGFGKYKIKQLLWVVHNDLEFFKNIENLYYNKYSDTKKEYYRKLKKRFVISNPILLQEKTNKIEEVISLIRRKLSHTDIHSYLFENYKATAKESADLITDANFQIRKEFELEKTFLLDIHLVRYEEIFYENFNVNLDHVPPGYKKAIKAEHMITAMETLFQKEKLLGIHTKNFKLKANNSLLSRKDTEFDITRLTKEQRLYVFELLKKANNTEELVRPILSNPNPLEIDLSNKKNDDISDSPIKKATETDIKKEKELKEFKPVGKSLDEVKDSMKNTLQDKIQKLFEKKNNKT